MKSSTRPFTQAPAWPFADGEMARRIRGHDWAATALGPIAQWPPELRTVVQLMLQSPSMMAVSWGPRALLLHNDAYARLIGPRSAVALGRSAYETFAEVRAVFEPHLAAALAGRTVRLRDQYYPFRRVEAVEDAWFDETHHPVHRADGTVAGVLSILEETTARVLAERERARSEEALRRTAAREACLLRLSDTLRPLSDPVAVMAEAARVLGEHLGATRVMYGEVSPDGAYLVVERSHVAGSAASLVGRWRMADFGPALVRAAAAGSTVRLADVAAAPGLSAAERAAYAALGIGALVGVPLIKGGRFVASLNVQQAVPRDWSGDDVALIEQTAERTWAALERARAERALRQSEARLRTIADLVPGLLWRADAQGEVQWYSERWFEYTGQAPQQALGQGWREVVHPQDLPGTLQHWQAATQNRQTYVREHRLRGRDGAYRWFLTRAEPLQDAAGSVALWFGSATDVHEQRSARELLEQRVAERTQALRQLLLRVETLQDEERRRIARELHDGVGQVLSAVTLALSALRQAPAGDAASQERLQRLHALTQHLDHELDRIVFLLRPTALEDCGLGEGVTAYVQTWSELTGVAVDVELRGLDGDRLAPAVESAVFRVTQEALNNVAKYAQASRVGVSLERRRGQLRGSIEDDGVGFEAAEALPGAVGRTAWGLLGMQERIEALGGTLAIESQPGAGTTVLWRLPLARGAG